MPFSSKESQSFRSELVAALPRLRRFAIRLAGSADDGDDVLQSALQRALERPEQFQPGTSVLSWMFRIVYTVNSNTLRKRRGLPVRPIDPIAEEIPGVDGERSIIARIALRQTLDSFDKLPLAQREVLLLVCVEEMSYQETAAILGIPVGTVMSRLARARSDLAERMNRP